MTKVIYFGQTNKVSADIQRLLRVGMKIFIGFIAIFTAILAKIIKIIRSYDQKAFWTGIAMCLILLAFTVLVKFVYHEDAAPIGVAAGIVIALFCMSLKSFKKDENGQSHWR